MYRPDPSLAAGQSAPFEGSLCTASSGGAPTETTSIVTFEGYKYSARMLGLGSQLSSTMIITSTEPAEDPLRPLSTMTFNVESDEYFPQLTGEEVSPEVLKFAWYAIWKKFGAEKCPNILKDLENTFTRRKESLAKAYRAKLFDLIWQRFSERRNSQDASTGPNMTEDTAPHQRLKELLWVQIDQARAGIGEAEAGFVVFGIDNKLESSMEDAERIIAVFASVICEIGSELASIDLFGSEEAEQSLIKDVVPFIIKRHMADGEEKRRGKRRRTD